jgi:16S rRNA (cytosine967-C5)-methyltransferase
MERGSDDLVSERERALRLLRRVDREGAFASLLLAGETGFVRTLVLGVLRWQSKLDFTIAAASGRKLAQIEPLVLEILRLGVYQLLYMDVPRYAAVSETVDLAARDANRARGFVNAVLRKVTSAPIPEPLDLATRYAHPEWLMKRWVATYGAERAERIAQADQELSYPDVLVMDGEPPPESEPSTFVEGIHRMKGSTEELDRERIYPMDEGSAVVASIARATSDRILDLAAAPGGKSIYTQWRGADVVSCDINLTRLLPLVRYGGRIVVSDGRKPPFRGRFDSVLLDAPCSATGTIRKSPELKWRLKEADIATFAALQRSMLAAALPLAERYCVYSTCSLERDENDAVVEATLDVTSEFERVDVTPFAPPAVASWIDDGVLRLTPDAGTDGFTVFVLRRRA